jgi:hypothetical protein
MRRSSSPNDMLTEGIRRLAKARTNPAALEYALLLIDAALLEHLRSIYPSASNKPNELFQNLQKDNIINAGERALLSRLHSARNMAAHGDRTSVTQREIELYATLIKTILQKTSPRKPSSRSIKDRNPIDPRPVPQPPAKDVTEATEIDRKQDTSEDVVNQQSLLATHRRTLHHYLEQRAKLGSQYAPPGVTHGIYEARQDIRRIKEVLRGWGIIVADQPDDEQSPQERMSSDVALLQDLFSPSIPTPQVNQGRYRPLQVFLCHATGDKPAIRKLYRRLQSDSIQPWLDEEDMIAGQDWAIEISKAIRSSDIVIVCLSRHSVNKVWFVQREIKYALDVAEEQPDGTVFVIPLRLEECDVPERLKRLQWINYFTDGGYEKLMRSLKARAKHLGIDTSSDNVYRFRAEVSSDVDALQRIIGFKLKRITKMYDSQFPDVVIEMRVDMTLEELRNAMRQVEDGHVMLQTVAPNDKFGS